MFKGLRYITINESEDRMILSLSYQHEVDKIIYAWKKNVVNTDPSEGRIQLHIKLMD